MSPLILDGCLIAVDTSETAHEKMLGQIVVAWIRDEKRLLVSCLIRFDHTDALISDRRENQAVLLGAEFKWRIVGRGLSWTGRPQQSRWKAPPQRTKIRS